MEGLKYIAIAITTLGMGLTATALGTTFSSLFSGIARNPEAEEKISKYAFIGAAFVESMGLFSLVVALLLIFFVN
jgi:F-type H+-transporting ATPase subunit c